MSNIETLLKLIRENPDLPVMPLVDAAIVADDDYTWWLAEWGHAELAEIYVGDRYVHIKNHDDVEDVLVDMADCGYSKTPDGRDIYDLDSDEWNALYNSIPWVKCIAVHIVTPGREAGWQS